MFFLNVLLMVKLLQSLAKPLLLCKIHVMCTVKYGLCLWLLHPSSIFKYTSFLFVSWWLSWGINVNLLWFSLLSHSNNGNMMVFMSTYTKTVVIYILEAVPPYNSALRSCSMLWFLLWLSICNMTIYLSNISTSSSLFIF